MMYFLLRNTQIYPLHTPCVNTSQLNMSVLTLLALPTQKYLLSRININIRIDTSNYIVANFWNI